MTTFNILKSQYNNIIIYHNSIPGKCPALALNVNYGDRNTYSINCSCGCYQEYYNINVCMGV